MTDGSRPRGTEPGAEREPDVPGPPAGSTPPTAPAADPTMPVAPPGGSVGIFLEMVKFSHTIFALPFALAGLLMARRGLPPWETLAWVLAAMVGARTAAVAFNRLADHHFDARNPRTANRALPAGTLSRRTVSVGFALSTILFAVACWQLNPLCLRLAPVALAVLCGYSLAKRFTSLSHLILGTALGISPLGAYLAVTGSFDEGWTAPALLGGAVLFWVAGFDIIYACQDEEVDRELGLHSLPARAGTERSLLAAAWLHGMTVVLLVLFGVQAGLGAFYYGAIAIAAVLLVVEHRLVRPGDFTRVNVAFFNVNAAISLLVLGGVVADLMLPGAFAQWRQWSSPGEHPPDVLVIIGVMLTAGHLLGEIAHRLRIPKITGYLFAGVLLGHSGLGLLIDPDNAGILPLYLAPGELMAQIALGLIVFTVGLQVDLWELVQDPKPALLAVGESLLCGIVVAAGLVWIGGYEPRMSMALGAIAMSSSPAVVILVRRELGADGPMVRRILSTVGLNNLISFVAFTLLFPPLAESLGMYGAQAWASSLYRLLASAGVGVLMGAALGWGEATLAKDLGIFLLRVGVVLFGIGVSENLGLSPLLLLLVTGISGECFAKWQKRDLPVDFGRIEVAFFIILFVVSGTHIHFGDLPAVGLAGLILVLGRVAGKAAGVFLLGGAAGLPTKKSRVAVTLCLVPMAGMALGLMAVLRTSLPADPRAAQAISLILAAVAVFETVGPPLTRLGLIMTGEVPADAHVDH